MAPSPPLYDTIGCGYGRTRCEDARLAQAIRAALGEGGTVVNVGAGAGSYEPNDRHVIAVEPSDVMAAQRRGRVPAISGRAEALPLRDDSVDAAMSVLSLHHWDDPRGGVSEMRRVARRTVVIVTFDPRVFASMWLPADYLPEVAERDHRIFPPPDQIVDWIGGMGSIEALPIPRDCSDRMLGAFWAHPEWVLDAAIRGATSAFSTQPEAVVERVVAAVAADLASGRWDARYGHLRDLDALDVGLRLICSRPAAIPAPGSPALPRTA